MKKKDLELFDNNLSPFAAEEECWASGYPLVAGLDEAGRGALAGPVVAAAVILPSPPPSVFERMRDSKKCSPALRDELFDLIAKNALAFGIGIVNANIIDQINILEATRAAMVGAIEKLALKPSLCLIDGNQKIPTSLPQRLIIKGDDRVRTIGAASILAKVTRDRLMAEMDSHYPKYGFQNHKGYGTQEHRQAIALFGPTDIHRKSFCLL